ncbi:hypothetical protein [Neisseria leonii]|uniref:hypothetical protein n=1 Tax=Neisseria leonii TaxID=2995413 RepID=UPI00237A9845|nr:hypothetical protein [Neisseria sp. 3986]MDD9326617.1 hypothetical protein [Neisseria sp. 3986]
MGKELVGFENPTYGCLMFWYSRCFAETAKTDDINSSDEINPSAVKVGRILESDKVFDT